MKVVAVIIALAGLVIMITGIKYQDEFTCIGGIWWMICAFALIF